MTSSQRERPSSTPAPGQHGLLPAALIAVVVLCAFQLWSGFRIDSRAQQLADSVAALQRSVKELESAAARTETAALKTSDLGDRMTLLEERIGGLAVVADEWEFIVEDVQRVDSKLSRLTAAFETQFGIEVDNPAAVVPELDWTQPELFEAARRAGETVGISLTREEIRVPAVIELREGYLEYLAVLKGGKKHEALFSIVGNTPAEERRPVDLGAKLNNAIQALGFKRGKPIRFTPSGTRPAQGEVIYLFVEWEQDGEKVLARVEDLVWNRKTGAPMERGRWVYVGSSFVPGDEPGSSLFAADLTAEAVATYSAVNTIIDNTSEGAADDTVFLAATPRIPVGVSAVTFILRREDLTETRVFDVGMPALDESDGDTEAEGEGDDADR